MEEWQKSETIILWLIIGVAFLVVLLVFIVWMSRTMFQKTLQRKMAENKIKLAHQQQLTSAVIETQEKERKRIAADLHDALIGKLTILQLHEQTQGQDDQKVTLIRESIDIARSISHDLSPPLLDDTELEDLIDEVLHPWRKVLQLTFRVDVRINKHYSNEYKVQLVRIFQEILTNMSKHAQATALLVQLRQTNHSLAILIRDNGVGFSDEKKGKGLGLQNIETRVQYLGGEHKVKSKKGCGITNIFLFKHEKI